MKLLQLSRQIEFKIRGRHRLWVRAAVRSFFMDHI